MTARAPLLGLALALAPAARASSGASRVWTALHHNEAIYGWSEAARLGHAAVPATVVHIDSHGDMGLPEKMVNPEMPSLQLAQDAEINNFVVVAIAAGLVDRVIWVKPAWGLEMEYGFFEHVLAWDEIAGVYKSDLPMTPSSRREEVIALPEPVHFVVEVVPFTLKALNGLSLKPRYLLDVDLDVFATENFGANMLRETMQFNMTQVQRIIASGCSSEALWMRDWKSEPLRELADQLSASQRRTMGAHSCGTPVHYSTPDELRDALETFAIWVETLKARGDLPGGVTIAESTDGYLPLPYLTEVKQAVPLLLSLAGAEEAERLECSRCVNIRIVNDLPSTVVCLWHDEDSDAAQFQATLQAGQATGRDTFLDHTWFFVEEASRPRYFRYTVRAGSKEQQVTLAELEALGPGDRAPAGPQYKIQRLGDAPPAEEFSEDEELEGNEGDADL